MSRMRTGQSLAAALIDGTLSPDERRVVVDQLANSPYASTSAGPHPIMRDLPLEQRRRIADSLADDALERGQLLRAQDAICDPREGLGQ
jgi:hypothetical protein